MSEPVKGAKKLSSANSPTNAISFLVERMLAGTLNTCTLVRVDEVDPSPAAPRVAVTPLVPQIDGEGNTLPPQPIYDVPYSRVQGGVAALIIDPVPGDIGIALFAQRDISTVKLTKSAGQPGSLRTFDQGDALYVGWVLNQTPTVFLELTQDGKAKLVAPGGFTVDCDMHVTGAVTTDSTITAAGDVLGTGISLSTHTHICAAPGDPTSAPQ
ncbi:hypothetical protein ACIQVE_21445 [Pseudomonas sp. NPDC098747]|uniref:hypothetical protein n=1 Tax=Pseudomonas sp. NPDC098747 TaxID=3364487 RepID=UPI00383B623F